MEVIVEWLGALASVVLDNATRSIVPLFTGMIGGALSALFARRNLRKTHNFAALITLTQSPSQASAYAAVYKFLADRSEQERFDLQHVREEKNVEEQLIIMLGTYQFIAIAATSGLVDKRLIVVDFYGSMEMLIYRFRPFIESYRKALRRERAWEDLIGFVEDNEKLYRSTARS